MSFLPIQCSSIGMFNKKVNIMYGNNGYYETMENKGYENFDMLKAVVFLTVNPSKMLFTFAEKLETTGYKVYIMIDSNDYILPSYDENKVTVLMYKQGIAEENGFSGSMLWALDRASARCKALYHFSHVETQYEQLWMIEEDVFIPSKMTLSNLDKLYPDDDLLCTSHVINKEGDVDFIGWPHWTRVNGLIEKPWAKSMISAIRVSSVLLQSIRKFANEKKRLLFDEILFNTIALHSNLKINNPKELSNIVYYHRDWNVNEIKPFYMYHPMKNWDTHIDFKQQLGMEYYSDELYKVHLISVVNRVDHPYFQQLCYSAKINGFHMKPLLTDKPIGHGRGFGMKIKIMYDFIQNIPDHDLILFVDGFDVLIKGTLSDFINKYNSIIKKEGQHKAIFSAEKTCWPDAHVSHLYPHTVSEYKYLNSGTYVSNVSILKKMLDSYKKEMEKEEFITTDDQRFFTTIYLKGDSDIVLDTSNQLFNCMHDGLNDIEKDTKWYNKHTQSYPIVFHANGPHENKLFLFE
jgi:hypothetical protein